MHRVRCLPPVVIITALLIFAALCLPCSSYALGGSSSGSDHAGLQVLTMWEDSSDKRIPVYVWYPSIRPETKFFLESYTLTAAREGKAQEGKFPIILMSHATAESGLAHHSTAEFLARQGFMVIAPTHPGDNMQDTSRIYTEQQITDRPLHLKKALALVLEHPELGASADPQQIGIIGYGTGATAALMLAGALPNTAGLRTYCSTASENDPYCSPWAQSRLAELLDKNKGTLSPAPDSPWLDKRIKAAALIAPAYGMLFDAASVAPVRIPLLLLEAEKDTLNPPADHVQHLQKILSPNTPYFILSDTSSFTLHSPCQERMRANYPTICTDPEGTDRESVHKALNEILLKFMTSRMINHSSN